ncbi:MAG: hypothetical protein RLZZ58_1476 [Pseudomonadota bacterium]
MRAQRFIVPLAIAIAAVPILYVKGGALIAVASAETVVRLPAPATDTREPGKRATAVLAGGCFWGVEGVFSRVKGVISVESGYHGGGAATAQYDRVGGGDTGHAEAVRIVYDPAQVSYGTLLRVLFSVVADPTLKNRQGPDSGTQYRAAIVPTNAVQRQVATAYLKQIGSGGHYARPVIVPVETLKRFYPAEAYHQDFMVRHPDHGYIVQWDAPKLAALKRLYPALVNAKSAP